MDWEWIREGIAWFVKTFLLLGFISIVGLALVEFRERFFRSTMRQHAFHIRGLETGKLWSYTTHSNMRSMDEEDVLDAFYREHGEDGVIEWMTTFDE